MTTALPIEIWDINKLVPYTNNAKIHDDKQIEKLSRSIVKFGWTQPIVVWTDGSIIIGHGRRLAALKLGLTQVPVVVRSDLSKVEADALRLADNRVTSTDYDMNKIAQELVDLNAQLENIIDNDLTLFDTGFDENELDFAIGDLGEISDVDFVEDIGSAVEAQTEQNRGSVTATDDSTAPVTDALGFKRLTIAQSRQLRSLMLRAETVTGQSGATALIETLGKALLAYI